MNNVAIIIQSWLLHFSAALLPTFQWEKHGRGFQFDVTNLLISQRNKLNLNR